MADKYIFTSGLFSVSANDVRDALEVFGNEENTDISVTGSEMTVAVEVTVTAETESLAKAQYAKITRVLREKFEQKMFSDTYGSLWQTAVEKFKEKGQTFSLAESCTGGLIAKMVTDVPGSSAVFKMSAVVYNEEMKKNLLGVRSETIEEHGVVSGETSAEMAEGVRKVGESTVGIGVTGFAGPGCDHRYPEGTVFISLSDGEAVYTRRLNVRNSNRNTVRRAATLHALDMLRLYAEGYLDFVGSCAHVLKTVPSAKKVEKEPLRKRLLGFFTKFPRDPFGEKLRKLVLVASICVMAFAGWKVGVRLHTEIDYDKTQQQIQDDLGAVSGMTSEEKNNIVSEMVQSGIITEEQKILDWAIVPLSKNPDLVGRIRITLKNGKDLIDQVVVQAKDNDEYLKKGFYGSHNEMGTVFMDYRCRKDATSVNTILYGHSSTYENVMFNPLHQYKDLNFLNENPIISYSTLEEEGQYKIFAVMILNTLKKQGEVYNGCYYTSEYITENIHEFRDRSIFDTNVDVVNGDKILTLSTCTYELDELRFVVMARKVRDGESLEVEPASKNLDAVFFKAWYEKEGIDAPSTSSDAATSSDVTSSDISSEDASSLLPSEGTSSETQSSTEEPLRFEIYNMGLACDEATEGNSTYVKAYVPYMTEYDIPCTVGMISKPQNGKVTLSSSQNTVTYKPNVGFTGVDVFDIDIVDGSGLRYAKATVTVYVGVTKQTGVSLVSSTLKITAKSGKEGSVKIKATSQTDAKLKYEILPTIGLFSGEASVDENGKVTYKPYSDDSWADTIKVLVTDGDGYGQIVKINVNSGNEFETDAHPDVSREAEE